MFRGWEHEEEQIKKHEKVAGEKEKNQKSRSQAKKVFQEGQVANKLTM